MKKIALFCLSIVLSMLSAACASNGSNAEEVPKMLNVVLSVSPEKGKLNNPIAFEAKVTYGKENVDDANEVSFEIWRAKDKQHENIKPNHFHNGSYRLVKSFGREGTYYIVSHVTAKGMHSMPKKEFIIGTPSENEKSTDAMGGMNHMNMEMGNNGTNNK